MNIGGKVGLKYFLTKNINAEMNVNFVTMENEDIMKNTVSESELNLEYLFLPKYKLSPFVYAGLGSFFLTNKTMYKYQLGGGLEYLANQNLALRLISQYDVGFSDEWDDFVFGKRNDMGVRIGFGINYYFGPKKLKN